jgi:hypothetical protein
LPVEIEWVDNSGVRLWGRAFCGGTSPVAHRASVLEGSRVGKAGLLRASLAGIICCGIALVIAQRWATTGERLTARVTDCGVWFPDTDVRRCDYHWSVGGERFSSRLPGADWPDGHRTGLWVDPDDPAHVDPGKGVVLPLVLFASFGLGLLVITVRLVRWVPDASGPTSDEPSPSPAVPIRGRGRARRIGEVAAVLGGLAVAAVPAGAIVARATHQAGPSPAGAAALPAPRSPVLQGTTQISADGGYHDACSAALGGDDDRITIVDTSSAIHTSTLRVREAATEGDRTLTVPAIVWSVALSPDGTTVAAGGGDGTVHLFDVATGHTTATLLGRRWVDSMAFSPDGTTVAVADGGTVRLWDVASLRATATLFTRDFGFSLVAFGLDGRSLGVCDGGGLIRRWMI